MPLGFFVLQIGRGHVSRLPGVLWLNRSTRAIAARAQQSAKRLASKSIHACLRWGHNSWRNLAFSSAKLNRVQMVVGELSERPLGDFLCGVWGVPVGCRVPGSGIHFATASLRCALKKYTCRNCSVLHSIKAHKRVPKSSDNLFHWSVISLPCGVENYLTGYRSSTKIAPDHSRNLHQRTTTRNWHLNYELERET